LGGSAPDARVSEVMDRNVLVVDRRADVHTAAQLMRRRQRHHVVVTDGGKIVGIVSAFDFLELVENHRFEMKTEGPEFKTGVFYVPEEFRSDGD
ncbi:MAG: CBS domain-containing protein, partial [Acidobacteriota bacterium]